MTDDDRLLRMLGRTLREQRSAEPGEAAGDLASQFSEPLSDDFRARIVAQGLQQLRAESSPRVSAEPAQQPAGAPSPRSVPLRPARRLWRGGLAGVVMAAAAGVLLFRTPTLPAYTLEVEAGDFANRAAAPSEIRAAPTRPRTMTPGSHLELVLRPTEPTDRQVHARMFVAPAAGGRPVPSPAIAEISPSGAVRWAGTASAIVGDQRGDLALILVVGPDEPPTDASQLPLEQAGGPGPWRILQTDIHVVPASP